MPRASRIRYKPRKCKALGCSEMFIPTKRDHLYHSEACRWYQNNRRRKRNGKS